MRILVIADYYKPDGGPAAPLYTMLCEALVKRGHEVSVVTTVPHFPSGKVQEGYRGWKVRSDREKGVNIIRVPLPSVDRNKLWQRMIQFVTFQWEATFTSLGMKYDVMLTHTPALEVWMPLVAHKIIRRKPIVYSVHDVYPEVGIKSGLFRSKTVIKLVAWLEKTCLNSASKIRILSKSFLPSLIDRGIPEGKIALIYDWVDINVNSSSSIKNSFIEDFGLSNKFIVMYAGNIGAIQGLESILEAASILRDNPDLYFVFVGEGSAKAELIKTAEKMEVRNVKFIPYQPKERMPEVWAAADIGLVSLRKGMGFGALPSKTFSIIGSRKPVLACVDPGSDTWNLIQQAEAGMCVEPEKPEMVARAIKSLKNQPDIKNKLGENGWKYVKVFHSPDYAAESFEKLLLEAMNC